MLKTILRYFTAFLLYAAGVSAAHAVLKIEITQGVEGALPIAVVPFGWEGPSPQPPEDIAAIITADLSRSGRFAPLPEKGFLERPHHGKEVDFRNWRALGADNLVVGRLRAMGPGTYAVQFQLLDVYQGRQVIGYSFPARRGSLRRVAHHISDLIFEALTGKPGAFNTRIAYVTVSHNPGNTEYALVVADADGFDPQVILRSKQPLMSPAWSPDGKRIAYVSFESGRSEIYVQEVATGDRRKVAGFAGINGAPAWSPDGKRLALTLSKDGDPEIYVLDLESGALRRLTRNAAIDTEPAWSPDGRILVFTSDRGGSPQLYRISADGGRARRITFEGDYNARAAFSPDGRRVALVHGERGSYRIAVLELESGVLRVVTDGRLDETPSFAPNGGTILYATEDQGRGVLAAVSVDGRVHQRLVLQEGDVREPAWSPYRESR